MAVITPGVVAAIGAVASAAGATAAFIQTQQNAAFQQRVASQNADFQNKINAINVARQKLEAGAAEDALTRQNKRRLATLRASIGAAGVGFGGSPLEIVADSAATAQRDLENLRITNAQKIFDVSIGGQVQSRNYLLAGVQSKFDAQASYGTLLGGFGHAAGLGAEAYGKLQQESFVA